MIYDLIVVGAGPSGSTTAREAASAGANVLLLDRAEFPRDKPCGGGVNLRAAQLLPFDLAPVTERTISGLSSSLDLGASFVRHYPQPLSYMTQRSRLDAYLVDRAVAAGARLQEGETVRAVDMDERGVTVRTESTSYQGRALAGADGANGVVARAIGLDGGCDLAVALEGNVLCADGVPERWRDTLAMDLGLIPGGYGWLFPKGDHLNIGVGGWRHFGPVLRARLDRLITYFGLPKSALTGIRGHHLPVRRPGAPLARGRALLVGDAAGLVDPLSGEGIYGAIYSGRLAAEHLLGFLQGHAPDLRPYEGAIEQRLAPDLLASRRFHDMFHLMPALYLYLLRRNDRVWDTLCRIVRGEQDYLDLRRIIGPLAGLVDLTSLAVRHTPLRRRVGLPA